MRPQIALLKDKTIPITEQELQDAILARIRTRLPYLRLDAVCSNVLYFGVIVTAISDEARTHGYFGAVRLEVFRSAIILDMMARTQVTAWQQGNLLSGPPGSERAVILEAVDGLLGSFASAYQKAGNP